MKESEIKLVIEKADEAKARDKIVTALARRMRTIEAEFEVSQYVKKHGPTAFKQGWQNDVPDGASGDLILAAYLKLHPVIDKYKNKNNKG